MLEPKVKELVFDASATHLYEPGLKLHVRNALGHGATAEEITEVLAIVSVVGIHAVTEAAAILQEELSCTAP
ncbi:carboxymuconolactone decarboxylase family protein [Nonomuraea sp. KM88]|uniref:carboxymuconolactone decarboxylase family protein n=1 Tax=Nonomuraea sp. KM88 TaxID=3457427 RepID=UPI003FCC4B64